MVRYSIIPSNSKLQRNNSTPSYQSIKTAVQTSASSDRISVLFLLLFIKCLIISSPAAKSWHQSAKDPEEKEKTLSWTTLKLRFGLAVVPLFKTNGAKPCLDKQLFYHEEVEKSCKNSPSCDIGTNQQFYISCGRGT